MDKETKRAIILENYSNPVNRSIPDNNDYIKVNANNESCIDNLDIYILFDNDTIKDIRFTGEACAISISSSSIMIKNLTGKSIKEAIEYINNFENMLNEQEYNINLLKEAVVYDDINKQINRKVCAFLPYSGIKKILETRL